MKKFKASTIAVSLMGATAVFATTWYLPVIITGSLPLDQGANYDNAMHDFNAYQLSNQKSTLQAGDVVVMQYQDDGAVVEFTLGPPSTCAGKHCTWGSLDVFNSSTLPKVRQGPIPHGNQPQVIGLNAGSLLPPMNPVVIVSTPAWILTPSVTITQTGGGMPVSVVDNGGDGGGGSGGGSSGGGGLASCDPKCPPVDAK